jgi:hypothetical protein
MFVNQMQEGLDGRYAISSYRFQAVFQNWILTFFQELQFIVFLAMEAFSDVILLHLLKEDLGKFGSFRSWLGAESDTNVLFELCRAELLARKLHGFNQKTLREPYLVQKISQA